MTHDGVGHVEACAIRLGLWMKQTQSLCVGGTNVDKWSKVYNCRTKKCNFNSDRLHFRSNADLQRLNFISTILFEFDNNVTIRTFQFFELLQAQYRTLAEIIVWLILKFAADSRDHVRMGGIPQGTTGQ